MADETVGGPVLLCATDLTDEGRRAVNLAIATARGIGGRILLLHAADGASDADPRVPDEVATSAEAMRKRIDDRLKSARSGLAQEQARCEAAGITAETSIMEGRPWETVMAAASEEKASLIVLGRRANRLEGFVGKTVDHVVRHAHCPVLVAPPEGETPETLENARWIVGVDFSRQALLAIRATRAIVDRCGGSVVLVHVVQPAGGEDRSYEERTPQQILRSEGHKQQQRDLQDLVERELPGAEVHQTVSLGRPSDEICAVAEKLDGNMIVVGTHGRAGLARIFLGSTAERLLHRATLPVLVLHEPPPEQPPWYPRPDGKSLRRSANHLLVAVDFSEPSERALRHARVLSKDLDVEVDVVHVFEPPSDIRRGVLGSVGLDDARPIEVDPEILAELSERLAALVANAFGQDAQSVRGTVMVGRPVERIMDACAARDADLIVLGSTGRTGVERVLLGSVAEKLVRIAPVPVLTVH